MKKKILIAYATFGSGHKVVAEYIYDYMQKEYADDFEIKIIDVLDYANKLGSTSRKVFEKNFQTKGNFIFNSAYEFFNHRATTLPYKFVTRILFTKELEDMLVKYKPDILISSHFFASIMMEIINLKYNFSTKIMTIITDYHSHQMWIKNKNKCSAYIVSNEVVKNQLINDGIKKEKIYAFGIPLASKFKVKNNNLRQIKDLYAINNNKPVYLFFAGGGIGASFSYDYLVKVLALKLDINLIFVCGKNEKLKTKAEYLIKMQNYQNVIVIGYTNDVSNLMQIADLVITKPGALILTECLELRKPLLLIPGNGGQENYNAKFIKKNDFGDYCRSAKVLAKNINKLYNKPKLLMKYQNNLNNYEENRATERICSLVIDLLNESCNRELKR